jgi:hypothetical protein
MGKVKTKEDNPRKKEGVEKRKKKVKNGNRYKIVGENDLILKLKE